MEREDSRENPSLLPNNINIKQESPKKHRVNSTGGGGGSDRLKRDEWSEGAVSSLLEAYEAKWILRNRAKLKGQDWEDVAKYVSGRANSTKSPKTQTQCKNKIESMKKRYRSESSNADTSSSSSTWPLYHRLDLLLRGSGNAPPSPQPPTAAVAAEPPQLPHHQPPIAAVPIRTSVQNSQPSNGPPALPKEDEDGVGTKLADQVSDKNPMETNSSTPALYSDKEEIKSKDFNRRREKRKKQRSEEVEIAQSIRWLAEVIMRSEEARLETMKEVEKMRAEADAKRAEMDLKRTEIIANTQLEIAKLFTSIGKGVDSSLGIR